MTPLIGAAVIAVALLMALPGLIVRLGVTEGESLSERHDRLDREAARVNGLEANKNARWIG